MHKLDFSKAEFIDVYNYHKFFLPQDLQRTVHKKTGKLLEISSVKNLVVIDIDNSKTGHESLTQKSYNKLIKLLPNNIIAEKTGNLGLHIYLYNDIQKKFSKNRFTNVLKTKDYSFDVFLTSDPSKQNRVLVSNSKIKSDDGKILEYKFIKHNFKYNSNIMTFTQFSQLLNNSLGINLLEAMMKK